MDMVVEVLHETRVKLSDLHEGLMVLSLYADDEVDVIANGIKRVNRLLDKANTIVKDLEEGV